MDVLWLFCPLTPGTSVTNHIYAGGPLPCSSSKILLIFVCSLFLFLDLVPEGLLMLLP